MTFRLILILALAFVVGTASAQEAVDPLPPATIGVIDSQFILINSDASQGIRAQISSMRDTYSAEITELEDGLRAQEQELSRQRAILAPEAFDERLRVFEGEVDRVQRMVEGRNGQMDRAFNEAMGQVRDSLLQVIVELSQLRGFNIILEQSDILFAVVALDITDETLARLNEVLTNVEVPIPDDG